jgi:hypothetical protein
MIDASAKDAPGAVVSRIIPERIVHEQIFEAPPTFLTLPKEFVNTPRAAANVSVKNTTKIQLQTGLPAQTITNFTDGQPGQTIHIRGDGVSTIKNNPPNIMTATGSDIAPAKLNAVYTFTLFTKTWVQSST